MSARSIWKGAIQLGLLTIPVKLYSATDDKAGLSFHMLCNQDLQRINMQTVCSAHGPISRTDTVKGFEWSKGQYVVVTDDDFESVSLPSVRTIVIDRFAPAASVTSFVKKTYYLAPEDIGAKAYAMLREALGDRVGIAKLSLRDRESLAALSARGSVITLSTLYWPDEIRSPEDLDLPGDIPLSEAEKKMAAALVKSMTQDFDPTDYADQYREALLKIIEAKVDGTAPPMPDIVNQPNAGMDLVTMLTASLAAKQEARNE